MSELDKALKEAQAAKAEFKEAHTAYIHAQPGRDLTIKQGRMHQCKLVFVTALLNFFDEYEKSGVL